MSKELFDALENADTIPSNSPMLDEIAGFLLATHHMNWTKKGHLSAVHTATALCGVVPLRNRMTQARVYEFDAAIAEARTILAAEINRPNQGFTVKIVNAIIHEGH